MQKIVPIVLISDDNYALATSVAIQSIIANKRQKSEYKIYVLGIDISKENTEKLKSQSKKGALVEVLNLENKYKDIEYSHSYISKALFFKFDISNIFPQYDKILYLDGDISVCGDLTDFFDTELEDNYIAGIKDLICFYEKNQWQNLQTKSYFNAGVMLLNARKIREENLYPKFIEELTTHNYPNSDQDVFNKLFDGKVKFVSLKYNFISLYCLFDSLENYREKWSKENGYNLKDCNTALEEELKDYEQSMKRPLIIHFAGDKPWNLKKGKMFSVWRKYFKQSPYKNEKLKWQKKHKFFGIEEENDRKKIRIFGVGISLKKKPLIKNPLISVVVASYNYENYIGQTLNSILNQSYKNFEIIIVDDGSKDNSVQIINEYCQKYDNIKLYTHENGENKGLARTVQLAVSKANGEYIAFCESDDYWSENVLEEKIKIINRAKNIDFVSNKVEIINLGMRKENEAALLNYIDYTNRLLKQKNGKNIFEYMLIGNVIPTFSCVMVKKEVIKKCDFNPIFTAWLDFWLWSQILIDKDVYFASNAVTYWRKHKESYLETDTTSTLKKEEHLNKQFSNLKEKYPKEYKKAQRKLRFKQFLGVVVNCSLGTKTYNFLGLPVFKIKVNYEYKYFDVLNIRILKLKNRQKG